MGLADSGVVLPWCCEVAGNQCVGRRPDSQHQLQRTHPTHISSPSAGPASQKEGLGQMGASGSHASLGDKASLGTKCRGWCTPRKKNNFVSRPGFTITNLKLNPTRWSMISNGLVTAGDVIAWLFPLVLSVHSNKNNDSPFYTSDTKLYCCFPVFAWTS